MTDGDPAWHPTATAEQRSARARLLHRIRAYFHERRVLEVETPILSGAGNSDPGIEQFRSTDGRWLRTSPEYAMKRLIAAGSGDIFELGRVFRAGEAGAWHNPEFTLLEWYRPGFDHHALMDEVAGLVNSLLPRPLAVERLSYAEAFQRHLQIDPHGASTAELRRCAGSAGIAGAETLELALKDAWLDLLLSHRIEPHLGEGRITFLYHYPASQAALARLCPDDVATADRFEVFYGSVELANGYVELTDAAEQRQRFRHDQDERRRCGKRIRPPDDALLACLEAGLPACAGVALGFDRLLMIAVGADDIRQVQHSPHEEPK